MSATDKALAALNAVAHGQNPLDAVDAVNSGGAHSTHSIDIPDIKHLSLSEVNTPKTPADEAIDYFEALAPKNATIQVYELKLDPDGGPSKEKSYIRLPPPYEPYVLRISLDAGTPASRNGVFKTNFPIDGGAFDRKHFAERQLPTDVSRPIQIDLPISHAGAFAYWVEYESENERIKGREGYFNIDPILRVKARAPIIQAENTLSFSSGGGALQEGETKVPLDGLVILTLVGKWMGTFDEWRPHLKEASERGYNMIHYTPLQQGGSSGSPYSLADFLSFNSGLFGTDWKGSREDGVERMKEMLKIAKEEFGLLSLTDVVLNHCASDSPWLLDHPEAGYSPLNTPHLTPAVELDTLMLEFSSSLKERGLPTTVKSSGDIDVLMGAFGRELSALNFWQYYVLNTAKERSAIKEALPSAPAWTGETVASKSAVELATLIRSTGRLDDSRKFHERFAVTVSPQYAASLIKASMPDVQDEDALADAWIRVVDVLNVPLYEEWTEDTRIALDGIKNRMTYTRLADHGPKLGEISQSSPMVEQYFTHLHTDKHDQRARYLANNGWIWNADAMKNFALPPSKAYLRREVIVWGDCVKLRYGNGPEDNPWLWQLMKGYVESLAAIFDGFRVDNCHSTPLHVAVALFDAARVVNPDLYVCAELFTGSAETDKHFVSRLGLNSLIREAYNGHDPKNFSSLLYEFGLGKPVGSMDAACLTSKDELPPPTGKGPTRPCVVTPLQGSNPHALFFDLTHDNESPMHKRTAEDALATGALVTFSACAVGSNNGFDDLYPKLLDIVGEKRKYQLSREGGIRPVKRVLNHLHTEMMIGGYTEGHVHQENDYIVISRVNPTTQKGYVLIAHTAFAGSRGNKDRGWIAPIKLSRAKARFIFGAAVDIESYDFKEDPSEFCGLPSKLIQLEPVQANGLAGPDGPYSEIIVPSFFPPGAVMVFETQMSDFDEELDVFCATGAEEAFKDLKLVELNVMLHRESEEEKDALGESFAGSYAVPGANALMYCGLEGWMHPLKHIMKTNDLGHPLCHNLRAGTWAFDYVYERLTKNAKLLPGLEAPANWFKERFDRVKNKAPFQLRPKYFALIMSTAYKAARRVAIEQCSEFVVDGHDLTHDLSLCSIQMYGLVQSASLDPGKPVPSLAAGLPHFAKGWARTWGRDVFISLRGLFLTTGNFEAAKAHITSFSSTLKHGLIPNLLDSVRRPRYNSRDSPWWMLQNIQDYVKSAPEGTAFLSEAVKRRFPKDETWVPWDDPRAYEYSSSIAEVVQEILQRHAEGIHFREFDAGPNLDMQMRDEGFNIDVHVDWSTGFIHGGNRYNCGTWMDKMGESVKAGTKGIPGTPRDGAPVEITGLVASTLRWVAELSEAGKFPFKGVEAEINGSRRLVTYREWADLIKANFEKHYYVPQSTDEDGKYALNFAIVNRRGIYKDVYGSGEGREWSDYQLRCNFPIAMVVAPELFDSEHALAALKIADKTLRSPLGMKTLDPADGQYRPNYDNSNDSDDPSVAKGLNYHNGPEWGWPLGYFLRAYLHFDTLIGAGKDDKNVTLHRLSGYLLPIRRHVQNDPWRGIPELTNENGSYCHDSCATQAWSASTILDFLEDVHKLNRA